MNPFEERKKQQEQREKALKESLGKIKHLIAVGSGKGGVGKSTVAANLALSLKRQGFKVGLADVDIYDPSIPTLFGIDEPELRGTHSQDGRDLLLPIEKDGLKLMSLGFIVQKDDAMMWRGPMASNALMQLLGDTLWGELDYLIMDMPPGTGDIQLTLIQTFKPSGALFVCTPQQLAVNDVRRSIRMFEDPHAAIPILGLVENMAYFTPKELPENKYYIFGKDGGKKLAEELQIDFLGQIPISCAISQANDKGTPIADEEESPEGLAFKKLAELVVKKTK